MTVTVDQILDFEGQFDACLQATFGPLLQPYGIPFVPYHSTQQALVPRLQGRFQAGSQLIDRGQIFAATGDRATPQAFGGHIILDLMTRRGVQDPRPTLGLLRSWMLPKYQYLNHNLTYIQVMALDMVDSKRSTFDDGKEKCDISTISYQIIFDVLPQYHSILTS